jgi:hypothetical protein
MYLVQILLPLYDNQGHPFARAEMERVHAELAERFGGVTAYLRSPAHGVWKEGEGGEAAHDDVILVEVVAERLDRHWWAAYREGLERRFRQEEMLIRALPAERL